MSQPPGMARGATDRQVRYGRIIGLVFCVLGFIIIGLGWNGMAKVACPDCQLPYLLSGGATGLGLVVLGVGLLIASQIRDERMKLGEQIREVGATIGKSLATSIGGATGEQVVAGKSTYHRPTCRLVEGKAEVDLVSVDVARLNGLSPCRVCDPPVPKDAPVPPVAEGGDTPTPPADGGAAAAAAASASDGEATEAVAAAPSRPARKSSAKRTTSGSRSSRKSSARR